jgi:pimeloyl-ACP methyl ester carboxylesterase
MYHPQVSDVKNQIMIRIILKAFLLMTITVVAGLSNVSHAQQSATALTGEWVGNSSTPDKSELVRLSLTEDAGEIRIPLSRFTQKLSLVRREGSQVRFELSSLKLVMTGTITGDEIDGEAEVPGSKARFHLTRIRKIAPEILASYVGVYRYQSGEDFAIERFDYIPDILHVIDVKSGEVRAIFPRSETEFIGGPALYVPTPTRLTIKFSGTRAQIIDLDLKGRPSNRKPGADAVRIPIRQEEVTFKNGDVTLAGTLVTPPSKGKHPAVVYTHGGGPALREVYWGLGYFYAARGFVVLSYDKRGVGKSTGNWRAATFEQLADDAVAAAKFLQTRSEVNPRQIGFWGLSQGGWIAPLAASRFADAAFAIALSGGGLSPAETELFDTEYELMKAGYATNEIKDALAFQRLKNDIIVSKDKWDEYARARAIAKDKKWFRHQGIDVFGPEKKDDPFWAYMRGFYACDPALTLRASKAPLLAIFGELDTPEGVKAEVRAINQIMNQAGRRDYRVKVYPGAVHNLMEAPRDNPNEYVRLKRFPPGLFETMVDWTTTQVRRR